MTHASVFSGIGGPEVAATMLGWDNLFHCEINPFGRKVLDYWYPNSKSYEDITTTDFTEWRGRVDVLTGGFPCQPFSYAGRRRGAEDDRYLWPSMYRAIDEIQPTWVVAENVAGILTMVEQGEVSKVAGTATLFDAFDDLRGRYELRETFTLQRICTDLESHGYAVQPVLVPACAVGAPHRRDRVFIVARRIADTSDARAEGVRQERQDAIHQSRPTADSGSVGRGERRREESERQNDRDPLAIFGNIEGHGEIGPTSDTNDERLERCSGLRSEGSEGREELRRLQERSRTSAENGEERTSADTNSIGLHGRNCGDSERHRRAASRFIETHDGNADDTIRRQWEAGQVCGTRWRDFPSVSPVHRGNDGLPFDVDRLTLSFGKWRTEALKAYGNAIVPQVMYEIFRAIEQIENP